MVVLALFVAVFAFVYAQAKFSLFTHDRVVDSYSYYYAAVALARHQDPYDARLIEGIAPADLRPIYPYLYPPVVALIWRPFTALHPRDAHDAFVIVSTLLAALNVFLLHRAAPSPRHARAWALALILFHAVCGPLISTLRLGQINVLVGSLVFGALCALRTGRQTPAGVLLALAMLVKITPAVFLVDLIARRQWRALTACAISIAAAGLATLPLIGVAPWASFAARVRRPLPFAPPMALGNVLESAARSLSLPPEVGASAAVGAIVGLVILAIRRMRGRWRAAADPAPCWGALVLLALLAFPLTWHHHYYLALLPFAYFLPRAVEGRPPWIAGVWIVACLAALLRYPGGWHPIKPIAALLALLAA